ncbi:MAG TPA: YetF domain-containing protein [Opitutaceae bacterium]
MNAPFSDFGVPPWELLFRTLTIYLVVIVMLRLAGKKQLGQMGPTEFVAVLLLSNAVQNAMVGTDNSLLGGLLSAGVLVVASRLISWVTFKSARMRTWFEGTPCVLVQKGAIIQANLDRELLTEGDLIKMLRQQGIDSPAEAYLAVLDPEGNLTVARHPRETSAQTASPPPATPAA